MYSKWHADYRRLIWPFPGPSYDLCTSSPTHSSKYFPAQHSLHLGLYYIIYNIGVFIALDQPVHNKSSRPMGWWNDSLLKRLSVNASYLSLISGTYIKPVTQSCPLTSACVLWYSCPLIINILIMNWKGKKTLESDDWVGIVTSVSFTRAGRVKQAAGENIRRPCLKNKVKGYDLPSLTIQTSAFLFSH